MLAAALNTLSKGADVAGMAKTHLASFQTFGYLFALILHQSKGLLYLFSWLNIGCPFSAWKAVISASITCAIVGMEGVASNSSSILARNDGLCFFHQGTSTCCCSCSFSSCATVVLASRCRSCHIAVVMSNHKVVISFSCNILDTFVFVRGSSTKAQNA
jgi:hypothetical protein